MRVEPKGSARDILITLIDVVNQSCQVKVDGERLYCSDHALSAYEDAFYVLEIEGYAKKILKGKYKNLWELSWDAKWRKE